MANSTRYDLEQGSMWRYSYANELKHYGILGMRWGIRRFQDKSGRLTRAGQKRYSDKNSKKRFQFTESQKRAIKIGLAVAGTGLAAYGLYRLSQNGRFDSIINKGKAFAAENSKDIIGSAVPKYDRAKDFELFLASMSAKFAAPSAFGYTKQSLVSVNLNSLKQSKISARRLAS